MPRAAYCFGTALLLLILMVGCPGPTPVDPEIAYKRAIEDAATAEPSEISYTLTPIVDWNSDLIWQDNGPDKRVLMVTWMSWTGYDGKVGQDTEVSRDTWVTAAPDIQDFCRNHWLTPPHLVPRLERLLGLPPNNGKTTFVEMWVHPADLFRPSADPEITDREAELDFPEVNGYMSVSDAYMTWFYALMASSYGENGYPWTRLGYTYDWGSPFTSVGLSEFVIRQGATVGINQAATTEDYCRWW